MGKMVNVDFIKAYTKYSIGDCAGFDEIEASGLIARGVAKKSDKEWVRPKSEVEREEEKKEWEEFQKQRKTKKTA